MFHSDLDDEEIEDDKKTRLELLEPVIQRLEQQANPGNPAPIIRISGAVRLPGKYPLIAGGTIGEQVRLAGGFSDDAFLNNVEVRRLELSEGQGAAVVIETLDLSNSKSREFRLKARDTLRINTIPNYSTEDTVELSGEFVFPGLYTISRNETIRSLIDRAGGFSSQAFLEGAEYKSETARESQAAQLRKIAAGVERQLKSKQSTLILLVLKS